MYQNFIIPYLCEALHVLGRHTAHHQGPKTALTVSGFLYVEGCLDMYLVDVVRHSVLHPWAGIHFAMVTIVSVFSVWYALRQKK